jgi:hypothetical protein
VKLLAILKVPSDIVDIVSLHRFKKPVFEPMASLLGKYVCLDKNVALSHKIDQFYRFIGAGKFLFGFFYRFIGDKIFANKIVSLYSIFFSKIVYLYRFKRYIFEYRCPPLLLTNAVKGA